ncbi:MAG: HAMP domain-containing histidine kinase [Bacteroidales bacterium]|nr:HAMP domain-containing histidine kinase [Bacteroidales bacterium]
MSTWIWILIIVAGCILSALFAASFIARRDREKVSFLMDALEDGETNFRFRENTAINRELNRLRGILDRKNTRNEALSWNKLFRVITHEIMNTVTPIAALSDALAKDDRLDVKAGLETISDSSNELIRFVESYRSFAKSVPPVCKPLMVSELLEKVIRLHDSAVKEQGAELTMEVHTTDLLIYADEGQLLHVFNNLIKNALEASATTISIVADLDTEDRTIIRISNNGKPVPMHVREEIFVPFYTTKPSGNGIGLSLSRRIMNAHNGDLKLVQSDDRQTVFAIVFA